MTMITTKKITKDNELYLYMNGKCIYKRWHNECYSKVFDILAYDSYTRTSITDIEINNTEELILVRAKLSLKLTSNGGKNQAS